MFRSLALLAALAVSTPAVALEITSSDFTDGGPLKKEQVYGRCGGANMSPALAWRGVPDEAKSLVLTAIDTSAKPNGWSHWVILDLPITTTAIPKDQKVFPRRARVLANDFGQASYGGPCPPAGSGPHRYEFTIWAMPEVRSKTSDGSAKIGAWLTSNAIAHATITGIYEIK